MNRLLIKRGEVVFPCFFFFFTFSGESAPYIVCRLVAKWVLGLLLAASGAVFFWLGDQVSMSFAMETSYSGFLSTFRMLVFMFACREEIEVSCMFVLEEVIDLKFPICFTTFICFYFFLLFLDSSIAQNKMHVKVKVFE